jgi:hypothetical protein
MYVHVLQLRELWTLPRKLICVRKTCRKRTVQYSMRKTRAYGNLAGRGGRRELGMEDIIPRGDDCRDLQPLGCFPASRALNLSGYRW